VQWRGSCIRIFRKTFCLKDIQLVKLNFKNWSLALPAILLAYGGFLSGAPAAVNTWNNATSGVWNDSANWLGGVPVNTGTAVFNNGGTATVTTGVTGTYGNLFVGQVPGGSGSLSVSGGAIGGSIAFVAFDSGSSGSVSSTGGLWRNTMLYVGYFGSGTLLVNGGTVSATYAGSIAHNPGSLGSATVSAGLWNAGGSGGFFVGVSGTGTMLVNGGTVSNSTSYIGHSSGLGTVTVTGGRWTNSELNVGYNGRGNLTIDGGYVSNSSFGYVGYGQGSNGIVTVNGGTWANTLPNYSLHIGDSGTGTVRVNGGVVTASLVRLSYQATGNGTLILSGSSGGRGTFEASQIVEELGTGHVTFDGGILRARNDQVSMFHNFEAGDVRIDAGGAFIHSNGFDIGITNVLTGTGSLTKQGAGRLTLSGSNTYSGGTTVESGTLSVGHANALGAGSASVQTGATLSVQSGVTIANEVRLSGGTLEELVSVGGSLIGKARATSDVGGIQTKSTILSGTSSTATAIDTAFFSDFAALNDEYRQSDVLRIEGLAPGDAFVLQLSLSEVEAGSFIAWLDDDLWVNAIDGNTGNTASLAQQGFDGTFAAFQTLYGTNLNAYMGAWGTTGTTAWVVVNHNSDFAIIPEPATTLLVGLGAAGLLLRRRRGC
jgi:autotransporter-associated beta strand protein/T5SS/PEP-CTERM-associated repeat protein